MLRLNVSRKRALSVVKELDAFPKVVEDCKETTASGGGFSIMTFCIIMVLVLSEIEYYTSTELKFDYEVDTNFTRKIKINIDMTIAMRCAHIGADILDQTGQDVFSYGKLKEEPVYFELSPKQQEYLKFTQEVNDYLRQEYHALQDLMWRSDKPTFRGAMPPREVMKTGVPDACRVHGSLEVSKVAGNYHVTAGKALNIGGLGHVHVSMNLEDNYNFTHRIDHFSFGDPVTGVVYPLDGTLYVTDNNYHIFQYFIKVVPTEVRTYTNNVDTYQFAVTERNRSINHKEGSHGVPGIFVKYDLSALLIRVREEHKPYWQFLVRMCGIIGGVFCVSGMLQSLANFMYDALCCRLKVGKYGRQGSYDEAVKGLPPMSLPNEVAAAPLLNSAEERDAQDGFPLQNSGFR
ncbi:endoplasmic reticulum-Golgi intermediate compartment protein 2-like isoform X2 [Littorina saxatilis]|uniref:endoplasmic reticulum-Golgi intermediate compartment protein 2-like isoform X2 n=1 Tax=Littorina saxatilis TaxID=31220 RepID=UPI0038B64AE0